MQTMQAMQAMQSMQSMQAMQAMQTIQVMNTMWNWKGFGGKGYFFGDSFSPSLARNSGLL